MTERVIAITPDQEDTSPWLYHWTLPVLIFFLALVPRALSLSTFLTADEDDQLQFAARFLDAVSRRDWAGVLVIGYPGVPSMGLGALGIWLHDWLAETPISGWLSAPTDSVELVQAAASRAAHELFLPVVLGPTEQGLPLTTTITNTPLDYIVAVRLPLVMAAALGITFCFIALRRLLDPRLALMAAGLMIIDPFILAHSRVLHVDAPLAYFMFAAFVTFLVYLERGGWGWLVGSGLLGALGMLSKVPGVLLAPILLVSGGLVVWLTRPAELRLLRQKRLLIALVGWGLVAGLAFVALWPSMWTRPLGVIQNLISSSLYTVSFASHPSSGVFWGSTGSDRNPFYYLITIPFRLTPLSTFGVLAGLGLLCLGLIRLRQNRSVPHLPLLVSLLAFSVIFVGPMSYIGRRADRYILPVYFALDVLAAIGLWGLVLWLGRAWVARRVFVLAGIVILIQALFIWRYHPYYLTYFNPLFGGYRTAPYLINVGWGEGLDEAARYLNRLPEAEERTVAAWYSWQFAPYFRGHSIDLASNEPAYFADYTIFYINQIQRGFPSRELLDYFEQRLPEKTITLAGIDYVWIYPGPIIGTALPEALTHWLNVPYQEALLLAGIELPQTAQGGTSIPLTLYWHTLDSLPADFNVSLRVVDEGGHVWGQLDRFPIGGLVRTGQWEPGWVVRDEYRLALDPGTPPGNYKFDILVYDFESGEIFGEATQLAFLTVLPPDPVAQLDEVNEVSLNLPQRLDAQLVDGVTLVGHDWPTDQAAAMMAGQTQSLRLFWYAEADRQTDHTLTLLAQPDNGPSLTLLTTATGSEGYPSRQWQQGQLTAQIINFAFPVDAPAGEYALLAQVDAGSPVVLSRVALSAPDRVFEPPPALNNRATLSQATLGTDIRLLGYELTESAETLDVTLYWSTARPLDSGYKVFVHLTGPDDAIIVQQDQVPVAGERPTDTWLPGEYIRDTYTLPRPDGSYRLWVGMYHPQTGLRLEASGLNGPISDNRIQLSLPQSTAP